MTYDFNKIIERRNTTCIKWDEAFNCSGEEILPMWVADMDLPCPEEVKEAILNRAKHAVFGYTYPKDEVYTLIINRIKEIYGWKIRKEWIVFLPGVVDGIASSVQCLSKESDGIIIQEPVYHPFKNVVKGLGRSPLINNLELVNEKYIMNYDNFKELCEDSKAKLAILCSPHNPVGRVWSKEELIKFGSLCIENGVTIIADEIHSDIIFKGNNHTCFGAISEEFAQNSIVLMAPSKTFNVAGLSQAFAIIANDNIRSTFTASRIGQNWGNVFGITALEACYKYGKSYLEELLGYLEGNADYVKSFLEEKIPNVKMLKPEGTYLLWLDMRGLGMKQKELDDFLINKVKVKLNSGIMFGDTGEGFQRMNIGCPRSLIREVLHRLEEAVKSL